VMISSISASNINNWDPIVVKDEIWVGIGGTTATALWEY
jgi:DNA repair ATPase RecN